MLTEDRWCIWRIKWIKNSYLYYMRKVIYLRARKKAFEEEWKAPKHKENTKAALTNLAGAGWFCDLEGRSQTSKEFAYHFHLHSCLPNIRKTDHFSQWVWLSENILNHLRCTCNTFDGCFSSQATPPVAQWMIANPSFPLSEVWRSSSFKASPALARMILMISQTREEGGVVSDNLVETGHRFRSCLGVRCTASPSCFTSG